jgi:hypothetical protein
MHLLSSDILRGFLGKYPQKHLRIINYMAQDLLEKLSCSARHEIQDQEVQQTCARMTFSVQG